MNASAYHLSIWSLDCGMSVRCHCNLASCVTNNYMCKSERRVTEDGKELEAGCFVQELENESSTQSQQHGVSVPMWNGRVATARRGCIEMLPREKQEKCSDRAGDQVHCCTQDMCNYPKSFYPSPMHNLNSNRPTFDSSSSSGMRGIAGMPPNLDHQVWLRAAVIAVPICGLMILVVLIVVARRLLQSDDYKDGRPYRRKNNSSSTLPAHHPYPHHQFLPPTIVHGGQRSPYAQDGFHVKPVYMETSEYLLPPSYCTNCQQPHGTNSQPRSSTSSSSYTHENCRKNSNNSETEQLVHSHGSSSSSSNNSNHCHCAETHQLSDEAGDAHHHTRSFSWNSIQPPVLSGSSPELPAIHNRNPEINNHQHRKLNFLSKLGLSRSTQSDSNPLNTRPYNV
ncbi:unnamed protein product [Allacma fusca]|uniref:Uncharacterized protein n=1 Tax=Allacma fusca TaxID=39272 RepID=A0A8J2NY81_9HEXA|nr:unnamed protein product [Allacma fusca]